MIKGIYTSAVGLMPNKLKIDVIANNLANVTTVGFKKDNIFIRILKKSSLELVENGGNELSGLDITEYTSFDQGRLRETGNPLDLAISGEGFFVVETSRGVRYTRNGSFTIASDGTVVTMDGDPVLGEGGRIVIPDIYKNSKSKIKITEKGEIVVGDTVVDKLRIVWFRDLSKLRKDSATMFYSTDNAEPIELGEDSYKVYQGFLEESNVNPIEELVRMIEASRIYETGTKSLKTQDDSLAKANEVGKFW